MFLMLEAKDKTKHRKKSITKLKREANDSRSNTDDSRPHFLALHWPRGRLVSKAMIVEGRRYHPKLQHSDSSAVASLR